MTDILLSVCLRLGTFKCPFQNSVVSLREDYFCESHCFFAVAAAVDLNPPPPDFSTVRTHDGFKALVS